MGALAAKAESVSGVVYDAESHAPVPQVAIELLDTPFYTISDEDGRFDLAYETPGHHRLLAHRIGYAQALQSIDLTHPPSTPLSLTLVPTILQLNEGIIVTAQRAETPTFEVPAAINLISAAQLERKALRSTPEALSNVNGVWMQKTNHGGGSPIIRGLTGNQTLLMVDGVRLNNTTYRYGPNQYLNTVAPLSLERVEVIRGSGSVLHGSDALGGVVNLITRTPRFSAGGSRVDGTSWLRWMSSAMDRSGRVEVDLATSRVALLAGFDLRRFGDLHAGGDLGIEAPSGYDEFSGDAKARFRLAPHQLLTLAYQHVDQRDVPRYDQVAQRGYARYSFDPQIRQLAYARFESFHDHPWMKQVRLTASWHHSIEERATQRDDDPARKNERDEVASWGLHLETQARPLPAWLSIYGVDLYHDLVASEAHVSDLTSGTRQVRGLYPDGATSSNLAAYCQHTLNAGRWDISWGARGNVVSIAAEDTTFGAVQISPWAIVGNLSAMYSVRPEQRFFASLATGFRAPNVNDLSSFGSFDYGIEVPSAELDAEHTRTIEAGYKVRSDGFKASVSAYTTTLFDLIARVESTYLGADSLDGEKVYTKANVTEARILGSELELEVRIAESAVLFGQLAYTHGEETSDGIPLRRIPPLCGAVGTRWAPPRSTGWLQTDFNFAGDQTRLSRGDIGDHRIPDGGTPGWAIANLSGGYDFGPALITGGLQNIFDEAYRIHGSGIDGYGRSAWLTLQVPFGHRN